MTDNTHEIAIDRLPSYVLPCTYGVPDPYSSTKRRVAYNQKKIQNGKNMIDSEKLNKKVADLLDQAGTKQVLVAIVESLQERYEKDAPYYSNMLKDIEYEVTAVIQKFWDYPSGRRPDFEKFSDKQARKAAEVREFGNKEKLV